MKKFIIGALIVLLLGGIAYILIRSDKPIETTPAAENKIEATDEEISEENYSGSRPIIKGEGPLASAARNYVEMRIEEFETQANAEVPDMRADFGTDSPAATYTIDISLATTESEKTSSIILSEYAYTGGAHGSSSYKVFNASQADGSLISLKDIIKEDKRDTFTALVKAKLLSWRPEGADAPVVFEEDVRALTFDSFANWALDPENLILFFSQYEIGPGVLGAFPFSIPRTELKDIFR